MIIPIIPTYSPISMNSCMYDDNIYVKNSSFSFYPIKLLSDNMLFSRPSLDSSSMFIFAYVVLLFNVEVFFTLALERLSLAKLRTNTVIDPTNAIIIKISTK